MLLFSTSANTAFNSFLLDIFQLLICFLRSAIINLKYTIFIRQFVLFQYFISLFLVIIFLL